jgi:hypothetical protein
MDTLAQVKDVGAESSIVVAVVVSFKIMAVLLGANSTALGLVNFGRWFVFWVSLSYLYVLHYPKFVRHIWRGSKTKLLDKIR